MKYIGIACFCLILIACQPAPEQLIATEQIQTQSATPIPTLTPTLTPTPTSTSTPTATVTPIGGGSGELILGALSCQADPCEFFVYKSGLETQQPSLLFEGYYLLGISPERDQLLVSRLVQAAPERSELFAIGLDGLNPILLHENFYWSTPRWLPGTDWIAFIAFSGSKSQVFVIHPDGTGLTQITNSAIGVLDIVPAFDSGIYWEEGFADRSGSRSRGFRWTRLDSSETKTLEEWFNPAISNNSIYVAHSAHFNACAAQGILFGCSLIISKLDGSEEKIIPLDALNLPEGKTARFDKVSWLPNDEELIASVSICDSECNNSYFLFSKDGDLLKELSSEIRWIPNISGMISWPWSPDGTMFIFEDYEEIDSGYRRIHKLYQMTTGDVSEISSGLEPELEIRTILWLINEP